MTSRDIPSPYMRLTQYEMDALKALDDERKARNTPAGRAKRAKMFEQNRVIRSIILYGNKAELARLEQAYLDPDLDPEVKTLIEICWDKARYYRQRIVESDIPNNGALD